MKLFKLMRNGQRVKVTSAKNLGDLKGKIQTQRDALSNCFLYVDEVGTEEKKMGIPDWVELSEVIGEDPKAMIAQQKFFTFLFN